MIIDYTSNVGKVRLRIADVGDISFLPDAVYDATLVETNNDLAKASVICAHYILGMLAFKTHRKLQQLEIWGSESFTNYRRFLLDTISSPNTISGIYPIPFSASSTTESPLVKFVKDWNDAYRYPNQSQVLSDVAAINQ